MAFSKRPYRFLYVRDKPRPIQLLGVVIAVLSIGVLASYPVFGLVMALASIGLLTYQSGIEVNFNDRTYRLITHVVGQDFGPWKPLPPIKCVSVFRTKLVSRTFGRSNASITTAETVFQVNLVTASNLRIRLLEAEDREAAFVFAKRVSESIGLRIWDATERKAKWLD